MPAICGRTVLLMAWMPRMPRLLSSDLLGGVDAGDVCLPFIEAADYRGRPVVHVRSGVTPQMSGRRSTGALLRMGQPRTRPNERVVAQLNKKDLLPGAMGAMVPGSGNERSVIDWSRMRRADWNERPAALWGGRFNHNP